MREPRARVGLRLRWLCLLGLFAAFGFVGCDSIGGRTVTAEFREAPGVRGGESVYSGGVEIGKTGAPSVVERAVRIPVHLTRRNRAALGPGTVFLLTQDPQEGGRKCLVAYDLGTARSPRSGEGVYPGASDEAELVVIAGAQVGRQLWGAVRDWVSSKLREGSE